MIDWDDVRYFLAVANGGSVRAAAERLGVNHSTVLRRIAQLEERLGAQMFEKLPSGYRLTKAGVEVRELAEQMGASANELETRVSGRDQNVSGLLRVALAPPLASHLLMPDFAEFARLHPDVELDIVASGELVNLTNREADVAIRTTGVPFRTTDGEAQLTAVREGIGITTLPCFVGDADPLLSRVPAPISRCTARSRCRSISSSW